MAEEKKKRPGRTENLKPVQSVEEAKEKGRKGGIESGKARREKKLMSQIYAEFLSSRFDVKGPGGESRSMSGAEMINGVMKKVLARGDGSSVTLMREIREGTEGSKIDMNLHATDETVEEIKGIFGIEMKDFNGQGTGSEDN